MSSEFFTRELDETSLLAAFGRGEHTPTAPQLTLNYEPTPTEVGNLFRKDNRVWIIRYQQSELRLFPDTHGMGYIHYLLEHPNTPVRVDKLYAAIHGASPLSDNGLLGPSQAQELFGELPSVEDIGKVQVDPDVAIPVQYREGREDLEEEEQQALRQNDTTVLADIRKRKADYSRFLSSEFGKRGKRRTAAWCGVSERGAGDAISKLKEWGIIVECYETRPVGQGSGDTHRRRPGKQD